MSPYCPLVVAEMAKWPWRFGVGVPPGEEGLNDVGVALDIDILNTNRYTLTDDINVLNLNRYRYPEP
jgi:hypothetical protein